MTDHLRVKDALIAGLQYLVRTQSESGAFPNDVSTEPTMQRSVYGDSCIFATAVVLDCLRLIAGGPIDVLKTRAATFLHREMQPGGVWSYWTRQSGKLISPDVDDTSFALDVIGEQIPTEVAAAGWRSLLANRDEQGRFKTWLRSDDQPNDVDSVVNANVIALLGDRPETDAVQAWLLDLLRKGIETQSYYYYLTSTALYYACARSIGRGVRQLADVTPLIQERLSPHADTPLDAAQKATICKLLRFDDNLYGYIEYMLGRQHPDGSWERVAYYAGPEPPEAHRVWFGSPALTAAFCIQALAMYLRDV